MSNPTALFCLYKGKRMQVTIDYIDRQSFTQDEIKANAKRIYGSGANVVVTPESSRVEDYLYFALQNMITVEQVSLYFDDKDAYVNELNKLRSTIIYKVQETLDRVIVDNELRITEE